MKDYSNHYVVVDGNNGRLLVGNKQIRFAHSRGNFTEGIWRYPNQSRPVLFKSKENARNHLKGLFEDYRGKYVRKIKPRDWRT